MLWLHRPPYLRWFAAALLIVGAAAFDLSERATVAHPFAAGPIERGTLLEEGSIEWRESPIGLLETPLLDGAVAGRRIEPGDPILPSSLGSAALVPPNWWSVPMVLPDGVIAGSAVRVITINPQLIVDGVVVSVADGGAFDVDRTGLVAVPEAAAGAVAAAAISGTATMLVSP